MFDDWQKSEKDLADSAEENVRRTLRLLFLIEFCGRREENEIEFGNFFTDNFTTSLANFAFSPIFGLV
jgi:hypothetical protein